MKRAKELTDDHWKYIEALLRTTAIDEEYIQTIGFHYKTAMIHGYGHGWEDCSNERT